MQNESPKVGRRALMTGAALTTAAAAARAQSQTPPATPVTTARKIAGCGPLSIRATLASAHQVIDPLEADALSKLDVAYGALYRTQDFIEGRRAEAEGRPPRYQGK